MKKQFFYVERFELDDQRLSIILSTSSRSIRMITFSHICGTLFFYQKITKKCFYQTV